MVSVGYLVALWLVWGTWLLYVSVGYLVALWLVWGTWLLYGQCGVPGCSMVSVG